jgi:hypothetical protein
VDGVVVALNNVRSPDMPWARQVSPPRFMVDAEIRTTQTAWTLVRAAGPSNSDKPKTLHTTEAGLGEKPGLLVSRRGGPVRRGRRSGWRLGRSGTNHLGEITRLGEQDNAYRTI